MTVVSTPVEPVIVVNGIPYDPEVFQSLNASTLFLILLDSFAKILAPRGIDRF